jgi:hypothetical protein
MHKSNNGCFWIALEPGLFGEVFGMASYSTENSEEPGNTVKNIDNQRLSWQHEVLRCFRWN